MLIHALSHEAHPKAHKDIKDIDYVAQRGPYSWVSHPGYLGLILMSFGISVAFGNILAIFTSVLLATYYYVLAIKEEEWMLRKFGEVYAEYLRKVPDRFIPLRKIVSRAVRRAVK